MSRAPSPIRLTNHVVDDSLAKTDLLRIVKKYNDVGSAVKIRKKKIAFGWYGGKYSHLDWLLPLLPACHHYCEPFAGSGAVLINRDPSSVETYNDLDGEVTHFFRVLRDRKDELVEAIGLTPFSREEYFFACQKPRGRISSVERARRFVTV